MRQTRRGPASGCLFVAIAAPTVLLISLSDKVPERKSLAPHLGSNPRDLRIPTGRELRVRRNHHEGVTATAFTAFHPTDHENCQDGFAAGSAPGGDGCDSDHCRRSKAVKAVKPVI